MRNTVANSGDYMQSFAQDLTQIIVPMTGYSSPELASTTIVTPSGTLVDGLATALIVIGSEEGLDLVI